MLIREKSISNLLDEYRELASKKDYEKLPYDCWKQLLWAYKNNAPINIYGVDDEVRIFVGREYWTIHKPLVSTVKNFFTYWVDKTSKMKTPAEKTGEVLSDKLATNTATSSELKTTWNSLAISNNAINKAIINTGLNISHVSEINFGNGYTASPQEIREALEYYEKIKNKNKKEEERTMNLFSNFNFGSCEDDNIRMSPYGLAIQNAAGNWVSYDSANGSIIDVDILNFDGAKFFFKLPVAHKDIQIGDIIIHNRVPMFVEDVNERSMLVVDPRSGEEKSVLLAKSPFGFNYTTKVVSLVGNLVGDATEDKPFGNLLPFMLMSNDGYNDNSNLLMAMALSGGNLGEMNPLMLYALMGNNNSDNLLPVLAMTGNFKF